MSNKAMSWAIEVRCLPIATKAVLMLLADCHNGSTGACHPSMEWLMDRTGLKARALQLHLKAIEDAGLMEREYDYHGRGKGCSVAQFNLKIGIIGAVIGAQNNADAKNCARKITSLDAQNIAPSYKEEPEKNRNTKIEKSDFDEAWKLWNSCKLKVGQSKKPAKAQWPKAVKKAGGSEPILKAIAALVDRKNSFDGKGFESNLPDMWRWLRDERWADVEESAPASVEMDLDSWREAMRRFVDHEIWPDFLGPKPGEPGCRVPDGLLNYWRKTQEIAA